MISRFEKLRFMGLAYSATLMYFIVLRLRAQFPRPDFPYTHADLRELPLGSLGKTVADYMDERGYTLLRGYEQHDIKHVLFGYDMDAAGEVRLQAFRVGFGQFGVPMLGTLLFGAVFLPDYWRLLWTDFKRGRRAKKYAKHLNYKHLIPLPLHIAQARMGAPVVFF